MRLSAQAAWTSVVVLAGGACAEPPGVTPPASRVPEGMIPACAVLRCRPSRKISLVEGAHTYDIDVGPSPYCAQNGVIVFPGDDFFVTAPAEGAGLQNFQFVDPPAVPKDVLRFQFAQKPSGDRAMILTIDNYYSQTIIYHATMEHPGHRRDGLVKTTTCAVRVGKTMIERWPHPIQFLVLKDFRFGDNNGACAYY